ncbi:hypothetical protein PIB30_116073, partial [Stylosanthes scabra]|nr:hypothetical protein [Stylosanthes scabra]
TRNPDNPELMRGSRKYPWKQQSIHLNGYPRNPQTAQPPRDPRPHPYLYPWDPLQDLLPSGQEQPLAGVCSIRL